MLHTTNAEDSVSKALKAGGNLASQAPLFKGISTAAKGLNVLVNGKAISSPIINKVSKSISIFSVDENNGMLKILNSRQI